MWVESCILVYFHLESRLWSMPGACAVKQEVIKVWQSLLQSITIIIIIIIIIFIYKWHIRYQWDSGSCLSFLSRKPDWKRSLFLKFPKFPQISSNFLNFSPSNSQLEAKQDLVFPRIAPRELLGTELPGQRDPWIYFQTEDEAWE